MERLTEWVNDGEAKRAVPRMELRKNGHQRCCNKLAEYEDAEEQGLLIQLPFAVGDIVYWSEKEIYPFEIKEIRIDKFGINVRFAYRGTDENKRYWEIEKSVDVVGKTVFLTREEAEKALERMNKNA